MKCIHVHFGPLWACSASPAYSGLGTYYLYNCASGIHRSKISWLMAQVAKSGGLDKVPGFKKPGTGVNPTPTTTTPTSGFTSSTTEEVTSVEIPMPEASAPEKKGGSVLGSVFGTLVGLAVLAGVAAFGWKCARRLSIFGFCAIGTFASATCRSQDLFCKLFRLNSSRRTPADRVRLCRKYQEHQARQMGEYRPMDFEAIGDDGIPLA